jgi:hypothetical protein
MSEISKRFEQIINSTQRKLLSRGAVMPERTERGIRVGSAEIIPEGPYKHIELNGYLVYTDISLNKVAIKIANELALKGNKQKIEELYQLDKEYNRFFVDSSFFLERYHSAKHNGDEFRQELMWIRYEDAKIKAQHLKEKAEELAEIA